MDDDELIEQFPPALRDHIKRSRETKVDDDELAAEIDYLDLEGLPTPAPDANGAMPREVLRAYRRLLDGGHKHLADVYMGRYSAAEGKQESIYRLDPVVEPPGRN